MALYMTAFRRLILSDSSMQSYLITADKNVSWRSFFDPIKKCHYRSSNIPKLTLAIRIYSGLARHSEIYHEAMDKLCHMLLHPFPLVSDAFDLPHLLFKKGN